MLTSGDVQGDRWKEVVEIVAEIIRQDNDAKTGFKNNLAVAIGLTFSTSVRSMATGEAIDGIRRYHSYTQWADEKQLFEPFYNLNTWQMRYVVGSWAQDQELVWARNNVLESHKSAEKVADVCHRMVAYTLHNEDGVSVHDPGFYYYKPVTLEWIHKIGGVCGSISKFGSAMAQAFGIPALPVGQPGHCAYIWLKGGQSWVLGNDISGWAKSNTHSGIQYTWHAEASFFKLMQQAQHDSTSYPSSEMMRIIADHFSRSEDRFEILEDSTTVCPQNYDAWKSLKESLTETNIQRDTMESALLPTLERYKEEMSKEKNIAVNKKVSTSSSQSTAYLIVSGQSSWATPDKAVTVEIDLGAPCNIREISIHWWGYSRSNDYDVYVKVNDQFKKVATRKDERTVSNGGLNGYSILQGWEHRITKVKFELRKGRLDPWYGKYYIGIRKVTILGVEHENTDIISKDISIETNIPLRGDALVDGNQQTSWSSPITPSWIHMDLGSVCSIDYMDLIWTNGVNGNQDILAILGGNIMKTISGQFGRVEVSSFASNLAIKMTLATSYSLNEVEVIGKCYSCSDVLEKKISLEHSVDTYLRNKIIDAMK